jgi:hypothetical protein
MLCIEWRAWLEVLVQMPRCGLSQAMRASISFAVRADVCAEIVLSIFVSVKPEKYTVGRSYMIVDELRQLVMHESLSFHLATVSTDQVASHILSI